MKPRFSPFHLCPLGAQEPACIFILFDFSVPAGRCLRSQALLADRVLQLLFETQGYCTTAPITIPGATSWHPASAILGAPSWERHPGSAILGAPSWERHPGSA